MCAQPNELRHDGSFFNQNELNAIIQTIPVIKNLNETVNELKNDELTLHICPECKNVFNNKRELNKHTQCTPHCKILNDIKNILC